MFDAILKSVGSKFGLGDKATDLLSILLTHIQTHGLDGILDKVKVLGLDFFGKKAVTSLSGEQIKGVFGNEFLDQTASKLGLGSDSISGALGAMLPGVVSKLAPGGVVPSLDNLQGLVGGMMPAIGGLQLGGSALHIGEVGVAGATGVGNATASHTATNALVAKLFPIILLGMIGVGGYFACNSKPADMDSHGEPGALKVNPPIEKNEAPAVTAPATNAPPVVETGRAALDRLAAQTEVKPDELVKALNLCVINFDTAKADIAADSKALLTEAASVIKKTANGTKIEIGGHTDSQGNADANISLSLNRAKSVMKTLVGLGCNSAMFSVKGFGSTKPVADNGTQDGRAKNRRMEFKLL